MGFFGWKLWSEHRKNKESHGHHILSGLRIRRMKSTPEKITPWYSDYPPPSTLGDRSPPPNHSTSPKPLPSFSFASHSSSNSTVPSHGFADEFAPANLPPPNTSYNHNPLFGSQADISNSPQARLIRSPSRSSQSTTSTASTSLSLYPLTSATYNFNPTRDDELPLVVGLSLRVVATFDDGWAWVIDDLNEERRGMVPCECLEMYTGSTSASAFPNPDSHSASSSRPASSSNTTEAVNWDYLTPTQCQPPKPGDSSASGSRRLSMMTVTDISERSSSLNHSYGSSASTMTGDLLWVKPKKRLRIQNPDTDT